MLRIIAIIGFVIMLSSCVNNSSNDLAIYKSLNEGMEKSIKTMSYVNALIYKEFETKRTDPKTHEKAVVWWPKVDAVKNLSDSLSKFIRYLKIDLNNLASQESDMGAVEKVFKQNKTDELLEKILLYRRNMLSLNEEMNKVFIDRHSILTNGFDTSRANFEAKYFKNKPAIAILSMLSMLENNVRVMENDVITFCNYKVYAYDENFSVFNILVAQSCNYIKAGDRMEISAGVGAFSVANKPKITIDGKFFQPDYSSNGIASYKFKTPLKAGKYSIPVKIEYTDVDGSKKIQINKVEYTVVE